jgi:hypothetical protein
MKYYISDRVSNITPIAMFALRGAGTGGTSPISTLDLGVRQATGYHVS